MKFKICFAILAFAGLTSCSVSQNLEYKGYSDFSVHADKQEPKLNMSLSLYNPNPVGVKLKNMELVIEVNDTVAGSAAMDHPVKIKRKQTFTVPVTFITSMDQLNGLIEPGLQALLFSQPLSVEIYGTMTIKKFIFFKKTFEFNYADQLKLGDIKIH